MTLRASAAPTRSTRATGWVPFALVALCLVPAIAGTARLVEVAGGPQVLPANARIAASPGPVVLHIASAIPYAVLGAFQFSSRLRRRHPRWHRATGRVLVGLGFAVALSALWMTLYYAPQPGTGELAKVLRLAAGSAMAASLVLGLVAIRRRDIPTHQAWMTRAYALALGAGTQVFTLGLAHAVLGDEFHSTDLGLGAGWVINLAIAEAVIGRRGRIPGRRRVTVASNAGRP